MSTLLAGCVFFVVLSIVFRTRADRDSRTNARCRKVAQERREVDQDILSYTALHAAEAI